MSWKCRGGPLSRERTRSWSTPPGKPWYMCPHGATPAGKAGLGAGKEGIEVRRSWIHLRQPEGENLWLWVLMKQRPQLGRSLRG